MRLRQEEIEFVCWKIVHRLAEGRHIDVMGEQGPVFERLRQGLVENLSAEDALNREVDDILRTHQQAMQKDSVDYRRMFQLVKSKLARERNIVI